MEITSRCSIDIEDINLRRKDDVTKLIERGENAYNEQIKNIANNIINNHKKIVLIAGPSSSGKTTSSFKLKKVLSKLNIKSVVFNMDNFFKDLSTVPLRSDGKPDMEGIVALDVKCIHDCLKDILTKGQTLMPTFDFVTHKRTEKWTKCVIDKDAVIIMEGIHALNPLVIEGLDKSKILKVYVHCNTNFTYRDKILIFARELRMLRRLVRDERERKVPFEETIDMWNDVCIGEEKNIRPFKDEADILLNSTHFYEPLLYKNILLDKFVALSKENEVISIFLDKFKPILTLDPLLVPKDSLVREFIGNN